MDKPLLTRLQEYTKTDAYPFHMPGHKRQADFPNPFSIDITEIEGFDNLLHPEGILKESMEWAAGVYGSDKTYYLINGSSSGILSAVCAVTKPGGTILMSRNCHKAVYHGVFLNELKTVYSYPQMSGQYGLLCGLLPAELSKLLTENREIQAVLIVSPTYDGVVSDIQGIAKVVHSFGIPLIVDEAHGAHFPFGTGPVSALDLGADIVIQSVHKTLPSLTQTAVMHVRCGLVNVEKLERYLRIYQSSSPSYVFMSSIESGIAFMQGQGKAKLSRLYDWIEELHEALRDLKILKLFGPDLTGQLGVYDFDCTKLLIHIPGCVRCLEDGSRQKMDGVVLSEVLRSEYHLEMELCAINYVVGICTCMDKKEGLDRLKDALIEIDRQLEAVPGEPMMEGISFHPPQIAMTVAKAWRGTEEPVSWKRCKGRISAEFIYVYPPGIPIVAPGEVMTEALMNQIELYWRAGLTVHGCGEYLRCVLEEQA